MSSPLALLHFLKTSSFNPHATFHTLCRYNSTEHPVPFHKAQEFGKAPKKLAAEPAPDLEDVFDLDEEVEEDPADAKKAGADDDADDISKDSLIKAGGKGKGKAKNGAASGTGAQGKTKGKGKK
jgi:replication factor C subunit 1